MDKNAIVIVHFNPIELYPPVINLLNYMAEKMPAKNVYVFTNSTNGTIKKYIGKNTNIIINRYSIINPSFSVFKRYRHYFSFYYKTYISLRKIHPKWLWYFETISALPVCWYFGRKKNFETKLLIHYHEYMSPAEYRNGPSMVKWIHRREKKLYEIVDTLLHTNEKRMQLFLKDNSLILDGRTYIFPYYPPKSWIQQKEKKEPIGFPLRIVYFGAIGKESLYIKEFCEWVDQQNGSVLFDVYSNQDTSELQKIISQKKWRFVHIKGYIPYEDLPATLPAYDVGVILYKGHIPNYVYNAPNKLFEYLGCGSGRLVF